MIIRMSTAAAVLGVAALVGACGSSGSAPAGQTAVEDPPAAASSGPDLSQFGDTTAYCASIPKVQHYVLAMKSPALATVNPLDLEAAFSTVIAAAPEVVKDDWTRVKRFEKSYTRIYAKLGLTSSQARRLSSTGDTATLTPRQKKAATAASETLLRLAQDPGLATAVNNVIGATHDLCHMDLVPLPGDDPSAYAVPTP